MRPRTSVAALLVAAALLASCGSSDSSGDGGGDGGSGLNDTEQAFADAWAGTLTDGGDGDLVVPDEAAACMGEAIMAELGTGPFDEAGVEPADVNQDGETDDSPGEVLGDGVVSEAKANAILDEWESCADLDALLAQSAAAEFDLDTDGVECLADAFKEGDLTRRGFVSSFTSSSDDPPADVVSDLLTALDDCDASGGVDSAIVSGIADSLAGGDVSDDQAQCLAQALVDDIGSARLAELGASGDFDNAPPEAQAEITQALLDAATACDVPVSAFGG